MSCVGCRGKHVIERKRHTTLNKLLNAKVMSEAVLKQLESVKDSQNPDEVEDAINAAWNGGMKREYLPTLLDLLRKPDHFRHEDIVNALQELKNPDSIDILYETATKKYSYYLSDSEFPLARKCIWALADIGTPEAKEMLKLLSLHSNQEVASYAKRRISRWFFELGRKGLR
jgi:HEAT repeat protein